jgi:hypothetical protein
LSYENYFDSTGIRDIKNIAKDVFAQHLTDCNALSSVPEIYHCYGILNLAQQVEFCPRLEHIEHDV